MGHVDIFNTNDCSYNDTDFDPNTLVSGIYVHAPFSADFASVFDYAFINSLLLRMSMLKCIQRDLIYQYYVLIYFIYKQRCFLQIYCVVQGTLQAVFISVTVEIIKIVKILSLVQCLQFTLLWCNTVTYFSFCCNLIFSYL